MTNTQTYSGSAKGLRITRERLVVELRNHSVTDSEDIAEACQASAIRGTDLYSASKLLDWLGY